MVERPIKKSERQTHAAPSDAVEEVAATELNSEGNLETSSPSTKEKKIIQPVRQKDKTKGKGKGREAEKEPLSVNRALVRGPKPKRAEPSAIAQSEEIEQSEEITAENALDEASEPTTADS